MVSRRSLSRIARAIALVGVALLVWAFWFDYIGYRKWKDYQKEFQTMFPHVKAEAIFRKPVVISELARQLHKVIDSRQQVS